MTHRLLAACLAAVAAATCVGAADFGVSEVVPIVTLRPGDKALLVPGAKVLVVAQMRDGKPTAVRALAGRDGFAPPM